MIFESTARLFTHSNDGEFLLNFAFHQLYPEFLIHRIVEYPSEEYIEPKVVLLLLVRIVEADDSEFILKHEVVSPNSNDFDFWQFFRSLTSKEQRNWPRDFMKLV